MRKVLIVSYHAPPRQVTAAYRIEGLIWNLPKFGWQPIVCSGPPITSPLYKIFRLNSQQNLMAQVAQLKAKFGIYSERAWIDKLISFYAEIMYYPDPMKSWSKTMSAQLDFDRYEPDLVMSHSFPHTSHIVASKINRNGVPWIASFSDLWTESHFYPYSRFRKKREQALEEETLRGAKCFITVSPPLSAAMEMNFYRHAFTIPNGYPEIPDVPLTKEFTLTYTGNFYAGRYDLDMFCWALKMYQHWFPQLVVRFYGQPYPFLVDLVRKYKLDRVHFMGNVNHSEALKAQKESHVLLHFAWNDGKQGIYSAKLLEYMGAKRPIVSFGGKDAMVGDLLEQTCTGSWCDTPERFGSVMGFLHRQYVEQGAPLYGGNPEEVAKYSQEKMAERHAELFNKMSR